MTRACGTGACAQNLKAASQNETRYAWLEEYLFPFFLLNIPSFFQANMRRGELAESDLLYFFCCIFPPTLWEFYHTKESKQDLGAILCHNDGVTFCPCKTAKRLDFNSTKTPASKDNHHLGPETEASRGFADSGPQAGQGAGGQVNPPQGRRGGGTGEGADSPACPRPLHEEEVPTSALQNLTNLETPWQGSAK